MSTCCSLISFDKTHRHFAPCSFFGVCFLLQAGRLKTGFLPGHTTGNFRALYRDYKTGAKLKYPK
jgi:hypothetical protein